MVDLERVEFISGLVGKPWEANAKGPNAYDCWHLAVCVQKELFGRSPPNVEVPPNPTWSWMMSQFSNHEELMHWVPSIGIMSNGLISAPDGAIVLMARNKRPAHCGVWLKSEARVIHADQDFGVSYQDVLSLKAQGWYKLFFYEPRKVEE